MSRDRAFNARRDHTLRVTRRNSSILEWRAREAGKCLIGLIEFVV